MLQISYETHVKYSSSVRFPGYPVVVLLLYFRFLRLSYLVSYVCLGNSCTWNSICPLGVNLCQTRGIRSSKSKSKTSLDLDIIKLCDMSVLWLTTYPLLFYIFQLAAHFFSVFFSFFFVVIFTSTKSGENIDSSPARLAPAASTYLPPPPPLR